MSDRDFDAIDEMQSMLFPETSFRISCFDSVEEILTEPVPNTYGDDTIIIEYRYRPNYYRRPDIELQDKDYIIVKKKEGQPYIRYCDVIYAIIAMELGGHIKPNHGLFIEGLERLNYSHIPMYRIQWGS